MKEIWMFGIGLAGLWIFMIGFFLTFNIIIYFLGSFVSLLFVIVGVCDIEDYLINKIEEQRKLNEP